MNFFKNAFLNLKSNTMKKALQLTLVTLLSIFAIDATAQISSGIPFGDLPPTNEYGKCYAKCKAPDTYETVTKIVTVKEGATKLIKVPAEYETRTERVLVKEGGTTYKVIPAVYETVTERIMVAPEKTVVRTVPAKYSTDSRRILVSEARGQWVKKKKSPNCFSKNPDDCFIVCYEEVPAKYRTETYQVLATPATTTSSVVPAKYKTYTKRVIKEPARVVEVPVDAQYKTFTTKVMISPESTRQETVPAVTRTVTERRLVAKGDYGVWTEILCASKATDAKVREVQKFLSSKGYNPGPLDGVLGIQTQNALIQYQQANGLPEGNMNLATLKHMGISED